MSKLKMVKGPKIEINIYKNAALELKDAGNKESCKNI